LTPNVRERNLVPFIIYEIKIKGLYLHWARKKQSFPEALRNGRANYPIFEELIREVTGLQKATTFDHQSSKGEIYEQKSYLEPVMYPKKGKLFHISRSKTFGANNEGPTYKKLLDAGNYKAAKEKLMPDYKKINYFIFTNTGEYEPNTPFRFVVMPRKDVLSILDKKDPRRISRLDMLNLSNGRIILTK
jgi:hypothetical protein